MFDGDCGRLGPLGLMLGTEAASLKARRRGGNSPYMPLIRLIRPLCRALVATVLTAWPLPAPARGVQPSYSATIAFIAHGEAEALVSQPADTAATVQITCSGGNNDTARGCLNLGRATPTPGASSRRMTDGSGSERPGPRPLPCSCRWRWRTRAPGP
jgi:hypothetical protein